MKTKTNLKKGVIYALITATISGIAIFYAKISLAKIPPLILTTSRNLYVGSIFLFYFLLNKKVSKLKKLTSKQLMPLILIGIIGGSLPFYLFFSGLKIIGAQNANLIHKTLFIWVTIFAVIFLKEKINFSYLVSFFLIFLANFYFNKIKFSFNQGEIFVLLATFLWSIENILAKKALQKVESEMVGLFRMGIGSLLLLTFIFLTNQYHLFSQLNLQQIKTIFIGGTILFFYVYFWYKALKYAPASLVTLILSFSTVVGTFLNSYFIPIKLSVNDIFSSLLTFLAIFILTYAFFLPKKIVIKRNE